MGHGTRNWNHHQPEEAEELIPIVRCTDTPRTHILSYAPPLNKKMLLFNELAYYAIPSLPTSWTAPNWLKWELGIFSGRLYFEFNEYETMCQHLGLVTSAHGEEKEEAEDSGPTSPATFTTKPIAFLQEWLTARRKGQDFTHTPMGYLCNGKQLLSTHPFLLL